MQSPFGELLHSVAAARFERHLLASDHPEGRTRFLTFDDTYGKEHLMELAKRDLDLGYGGRTFTVRAYLDEKARSGPGWHSVIVENRSIVQFEQPPTQSADNCLTEAVGFVVRLVDKQIGALDGRG
jgi:hypothetical protein